MGFSVSGSAAVIFAGMFIAFGTFYGATTNSFERVTEAQQADSDTALDQRNTNISIRTASYSSGTLTLEVVNGGGTHLSLNETDVLIDNTYQTGWQEGATVDGNGATYLWLPEETLTVTFSLGSQPDRVKVTTQGGVADTEVVG